MQNLARFTVIDTSKARKKSQENWIQTQEVLKTNGKKVLNQIIS